jgi:hypothetical protein
MAEEHVELGRVQPLDGLVVRGEVKDDEEVARVVVDLRALALRKDVLDVELVESEAVGQLTELEVRRLLDVNPGQAASGELLDARRAWLDDLREPGSSSPDACERWPCHRY